MTEKDVAERPEAVLVVNPLESDTSSEPASEPKQGAVVLLPSEQTNYVSVRKIVVIFLACSTVDLAALIDQTSLAAALSTISNDLGAGSQAAWIVNGYFVTSTCFQLIYGRLSDIWSRKVILLVGLAIFFFGSVASSQATTAAQLIGFRAFTGIGGGGLMSVAQMIVSDVVPLRERGKYQGILGSVVALANGIGPVIGGALAESSPSGWRWIFRLNLPLSVIAALSAIFFMPLKKVTGDWKKKLKSTDFVGMLLSLSGASIFLLGLTWGGGDYAWSSSHVVTTLVVGILTSAAFVLWQWKGAKLPLIPLHIFKSRIVNGACITMAINGWNFLVQIYYLPVFYQLVYGYSPVKAGVMILPITLVQTLFSTLSGLFVRWTGRYRECLLAGWIFWAVGLGLLSTLGEDSGVGKQVGYAILAGVGVGNTLQPSLIAIQSGVERRDMAVVTAFRNFIRNLGGTLGLAISGAILNNIVKSSLSGLSLPAEALKQILNSPQSYLASLSSVEQQNLRAELVPAYTRGFRVIFLVCAALAAFAFFLALFLMPQTNLDRADDQALRDQARQEEASKKINSGQA